MTTSLFKISSIQFSIFFIIYFLISQNIYSQSDYQRKASIDTTLDRSSNSNRILNFGIEKISNTFLFSINSNNIWETSTGHIELFQNYRGTSYNSMQTAFHDDENFKLDYFYDYNKSISLYSRSAWYYSADSRDFALNKLERLSTSCGIKINTLDNSYLEAQIGIERNHQAALKVLAPLFQIRNFLNQIHLGDFNLDSRIESEYINLDKNRSNSDLTAEAYLYGNYDAQNMIRFGATCRILSRDFMTPLSNTNTSSSGYIETLENRFERRIGADLEIKYSLSDLLGFEFHCFTNEFAASRYYKNYFDSINTTNIGRNLESLEFSATASAKLNISNYTQIIGLAIDAGSEKYEINNKYNLIQSELDRLRLQEYQKNNYTSRHRLFTSAILELNHNDSIRFDLSASLFRFDSPSTLVDDDRDMLVAVSDLNYSHRFSDILRMRLTLGVEGRHLVFLRASRSMSNNWNRVIRFEPEFEIRTKYFEMSPHFGILANYTTYDFEDISSFVQSFSMRQLSYRDSINYFFNNKFSIQSRIITRYYEQGMLLWDKFLEMPQNSTLELFSNLLFYDEYNKELRIGMGARFYGVFRNKLNPSEIIVPYKGDRNISIGPETDISISLNKTILRFQGWYIFNSINGIYSGSLGNFLFSTIYKF